MRVDQISNLQIIIQHNSSIVIAFSSEPTYTNYTTALLELFVEKENGNVNESNGKQKDVASTRGISIISVISLVVSAAALILYSLALKGVNVVTLFVITSIASVILPVIAKILRVKKDKKGKALEIIAIIVGGFDFYCVVFAVVRLPIIIGYLGWIVSAVAYKLIRSKRSLKEDNDIQQLEKTGK